ncbi:MAG: SUMF1/EgtB/PvdO family nonheme iron enzyme [Dehalococcoidia bacterium]
MTTHPVIDVDTALIPPGSCIMGSDGGLPDEAPAHRVWLSAFRVALLPVTNGDYAAFLDATEHEQPRFWDDSRFNAPDQPVVGATWFDAVAYCEWLSSLTGRRFRLPTEAEREKAAQGGVEGARYPWGDDPGEANGRFDQEAPRPVGQSAANGYGLRDIGYNVHEWCSDWYDAAYYAHSPERDPQGPATGKRRASRGGAWRHQVKVSRCAARSSLDPTFRYNDYGFRVAEDAG